MSYYSVMILVRGKGVILSPLTEDYIKNAYLFQDVYFRFTFFKERKHSTIFYFFFFARDLFEVP